MKRNKRTETMGHQDLTPLTECILTQMGEEGAKIRKRLKNFYSSRSLNNLALFREHRDNTVCSPELGESLGAFGKTRF
jgi:hypothetical protein